MMNAAICSRLIIAMPAATAPCVFSEPGPAAGVFTEGTKLVARTLSFSYIFFSFLHRVALGIRVAQGECLVLRP